MTRNLVVAILLAIATTAAAAPAKPTLISVEIDHEIGFRTFRHGLPPATTEPGGFQVPIGVDPEWLELGLRPGDLVRYANGSPVADRLLVSDGVLVLDIVRNGKPVVLHIVIRGKSSRAVKLTGDDFKDLVERTANGPLSTPMQIGNAPSGVRIIDMVLSIQIRLEVGDIVRSIGGQPIRTEAELVTALQNLPVGTTNISLERDDRPFTIELTRDAPVELSTIRKVGAAQYEVPVAVAAAISADPMIITRRANAVPVIRDGKVRGLKVFAIEKDSACAAIGLVDDDLVLDVDGHAIESTADAFELSSDLEHATAVVVHLERHGKPMELHYAIR